MQENQEPVTQSISNPVNQKSNNFLVILLSILLFISVAIAGFFAYQTQRLVKELTVYRLQPTQTPTPEPESTFPMYTEPSPDPTVNWKTYKDEKIGLEFKYPTNIAINGETKGSDNISLNIRIKNLGSYVDEPMGFGLTTAISDKKSLENGEYGYKGFGQNLAGSQKVIVLDETFGKTFIAFQEIEVCNVQFTRGLIFFKDNYQVIVRLQAPFGYAKLMSEYFILDDKNCGGSPVWKSSENFYSDIINNKAPQIALDWYNLFDQILSTFKFLE